MTDHDAGAAAKRKSTQRPATAELQEIYYRLGAIRRVAMHYGVGQTTVQRWLAETGVEPLPREPRKSTAKRSIPPTAVLIRQHHDQNMSVAEIGRVWDVSEPVVERWLRYRRVERVHGDYSRQAPYNRRGQRMPGKRGLRPDERGELLTVARAGDEGALDRQLLRLNEDGVPHATLAEVLGLHDTTVWKYIRRASDDHKGGGRR